MSDLEQDRLPPVLIAAWERRDETKQEYASRLPTLQAQAHRNFELVREQPASSTLLASSLLLIISTTIVNAGNYLFNLVLGRWLGPAAFSELSLMVTLLLAVTFITSTLQTVTAKFAATLVVDKDVVQLAALRRWLISWAWIVGSALLVLFALGSPLWMAFFQTGSVWPFILLGIGLPVYIVQSVERGVLQGQVRFGRLSLTYQVEMWVRLGGAVVLVALGWSVAGAVVGLTLSFLATWLFARQTRIGLPPGPKLAPAKAVKIWQFAGPVSASLIGQVIISNSDILIVKHFFEAEVAGQYAALALIGRIVFFATWSVVTMLIPLVAQKAHSGDSHRQYLRLSLSLVGIISALIVVLCFLIPNFIVETLFGKEYISIAPLLWLYALATAAYAMANVLVTYWLAAEKFGGSLLTLIAGVVQVVGLWMFHSSLLEVVQVQLYIMFALLGLLVIWDRWLTSTRLHKLKSHESLR